MQELRGKNDYNHAVSHAGVVVLEGTGNNPSAAAMQPVVNKLMQHYPNVKFYKFDVEAQPEISHELSLTQIPSFYIFKDGEISSTVFGAKENALSKALAEVH